MPTVWITFATEDNVDGDIDYLAQEISRTGWRTRLHPLFPDEDEKMDRLMPVFLGRPEQSDAWLLYSSERMATEGRMDRMRIALEAARAKRGSLPTIAVEAGPPQPGIEALDLTRRISAENPDWRTLLRQILIPEQPDSAEGGLHAFVAHLHPDPTGAYAQIFELRPKFGRWDPFVFAVLPEEKDRVAPRLQPNGRGEPPPHAQAPVREAFSDDAEWYYVTGAEAATPVTSYYVYLRDLPSRLAFGQEGSGEVHVLHMRENSRTKS